MEFYEILANRRKSQGLSYDDLSAKSSVPVSTLKKLLTGVTRAPQFETLRSVTYALGLTLNDLTERDSDAPISLSSDELEIVTVFRGLNSIGQSTLVNMARSLNMNPDMKRGSVSNTVTA